MKYLKEFFCIVLFSLIGEVCNYFIPLAIPGSIYGLVLLFVALLCGWIKLPQVRDTAHFLIEIMPILFVPAVVGLLEKWDVLQPILIPVIVITVVSLVLTFAASAGVTQFVVKRSRKEGDK